ncbi:MAG TPA: hypothetical protein VJQ52_03335 [Steroidobacteraceae bacterium]|nr:hypothetical protein [Steroidobacteraceae bacterium]
MRAVAARSALLALGLVIATAVLAQQTAGETKTASPAADRMLKELREQGAPGISPETVAPYLPKVWCGDISDEATRDVCWKAYRASLGYYATGLAHRTQVFAWQHTSTIIIFWVVIALVAAGLFFAWLQFRAALELRPAAADVSTVELGKDGFKISSPVLGVIILALSLAFFYLYLVYAYPIHELF